MVSRSVRTVVGIAMIGIGLAQAAFFATRAEWIPTGLSTLYSLLGVVYLWAEVYTAE